jgi:hypothetical protein
VPVFYKAVCAVLFVLFSIFISINLFGKPDSIASLYSRTERKLVPVLVNNPYLVIRTNNCDYINIEENWDFQQFNAIRNYSVPDSNQINHIRIFIIESGLQKDIIRNINIGRPNSDVVKLRTLDSQNNSIFQYLDEILIGIPGILNQDFYQSVYSLNRFESLPQILQKNHFSTVLYTLNTDKEIEKLIKNFYCFDVAKNIDIQNIKSEIHSSQKELGNNIFQFYMLNLTNDINQSTSDNIVKMFNSLFDSVSNGNLNIVYEINRSVNKNEVKVHKNILVNSKNVKDFVNPDSVICQATDIIPTILHLLHYHKPFISYGSSILSDESKTLVGTSDRNKINLFKYSILLSQSNGKDLYLRKLKDSVFLDYDFKDSLVVEKVQMENIINSIRFDFYQRLKLNSMIIEN